MNKKVDEKAFAYVLIVLTICALTAYQVMSVEAFMAVATYIVKKYMDKNYKEVKND